MFIFSLTLRPEVALPHDAHARVLSHTGFHNDEAEEGEEEGVERVVSSEQAVVGEDGGEQAVVGEDGVEDADDVDDDSDDGSGAAGGYGLAPCDRWRCLRT